MKIKNLPKKLILQHVEILDPLKEKVFKGNVLLVNGKIAEVGKFDQPADAKSIDCKDLTLTHGFCDLHVHFREPGDEDKETLESGSMAALSGGFTRVCTMPNTNPPIDSPESVNFIIEKSKEYPIHIHPIGAVTKGQKGKEITEMGLMNQAGAIAFSDDGLPIQNGLVMRKALEYSKMLNVPVINHAEDDCLRCDGVMNEGIISNRLGLPGNPSISESTMVFRDLKLADMTGAKLHVPHVSTAASVEHIKEMKSSYDKISAEVTPHHLFFNDEELKTYNTNFKVAPPIRNEENRKKLIRALKSGIIDCIATDHAPHTIEEKEAPFDWAPCGMIGLESAFGAVWKVLSEAKMDLLEVITSLTTKPRLAMGFKDDLFYKGSDAQIVIIDSNEEWEFNLSSIYSKSRNSPFIGKKLKGKIKTTISGGYLFEI